MRRLLAIVLLVAGCGAPSATAPTTGASVASIPTPTVAPTVIRTAEPTPAETPSETPLESAALPDVTAKCDAVTRPSVGSLKGAQDFIKPKRTQTPYSEMWDGAAPPKKKRNANIKPTAPADPVAALDCLTAV